MIGADCEVAEFYRHEEIVARKPHRCIECGAFILTGEKHFYYRGKWSFGFQTGRQHLTCMEACMLIRDKFNNSECIAFGDLMDWYHEMRLDWFSRDDSNPDVIKLRGLMAKIRWRQRSRETTNADKRT